MTVEQIYQQITDFITSSVPQEWSTAWIEIELSEDYASAIGRYYKPSETKLYGFRVGEDVVEVFAVLREKIENPRHALWQRARFTLQPDGQFNILFTYPGEGDQ